MEAGIQVEADAVIASRALSLNRVLDLTDRETCRLLGFSQEQLKAKDYALTQMIGDIARNNGFLGLSSPSQFEATNVIRFLD
jgi:hypothetical protein